MSASLGIIGAAYATVVSYSIVVLFSDLLQRDTVRIFEMKLNTLNIIRLFQN